MAKKIIVEEVYKTDDAQAKKKIIRQNLSNLIKSLQEKEICPKA